MPVQRLTDLSNQIRTASLGSRLGRAVLLVLVVASFALGFSYHTLSMNAGQPIGGLFFVLFHLAVLIGLASMWSLLAERYKSRQSSPARVFWTVLLFGLLFITLASLLTTLGRITDDQLIDRFYAEDEFEYETGIPLVLTTVIKTTLLSLMGIGFALYLIFRIRELVLFKRTKTSQRNWNLLMVSMVFASLTFFMKSPQDDPHVFQFIALIPAVGFMMINSFRVSWIVYLDFREKLISIGLALLLLIFLVVGLGFTTINNPLPFLGDLFIYIQYYNYVLRIFVMLAIGFGVMYCMASLLLLLFHLPTTGDFQRREHQRAVMHSLTDLVNQSFDPEKLYSQIAASPVEAGSAQASWLAVADLRSGSLQPHVVATHKIAPSRVDRLIDSASLFNEVSTSRVPVHLREASTDHRVNVRPGDGFGSLLAIPLVARDETLGVLFVTKDVAHGFEQDDIDAIQVYAAQAAIAMDNARLFEEQIEKERLARELDLAREMQLKLLPQTIPQINGLTLAASNVSAERVGGDYYDFLLLDDNRLCLVIGDVSGKGASAAFYMAEMQGIFQSLARLASGPIEFLKHTNAALSSSLDKNVFISLIYGVIDLRKEEFVMGRAGHCPAAAINLHGESRFIRPAGIGLGLDRGSIFEKTLEEERISLQPGDVFVMYTDGVIESRNAEGEEYGYERLIEALQRNRHEDAYDIHDALLQDLHSFLGHQQYDDDMTMVVLKWNGIDVGPTAQLNHKEQRTPVPAKPSGNLPKDTAQAH